MRVTDMSVTEGAGTAWVCIRHARVVGSINGWLSIYTRLAVSGESDFQTSWTKSLTFHWEPVFPLLRCSKKVHDTDIVCFKSAQRLQRLHYILVSLWAYLNMHMPVDKLNKKMTDGLNSVHEITYSIEQPFTVWYRCTLAACPAVYIITVRMGAFI